MTYTISREDPTSARHDLLSLWKENLPSLDEERLDWIYTNNPAGPAMVWIAREQVEARAIGSTALLSRAFVIDGGDFVAGIAADFSVAPGHRGFGPALALQRRMVEAADQAKAAFIFGVPTRDAKLVLLRAGFKDVGSVARLTLPLRTRGFLLRSTGSRTLAMLLAPVSDLFLRGFAALRALRGTDKRFSGRELPGFDHGFDELWASVRNKHAILGDRSSRFLRWRFERSPGARHRIFGLFDRRTNALAGYVVYHVVDGRTVIDDLLCQNLTDVLDNLLSRFARFQRREGVEAIVIGFFGDPKVLDGLRRNRFVVRDEAMPLILYVPPGSGIATTVSSPANWWFMPADNDL